MLTLFFGKPVFAAEKFPEQVQAISLQERLQVERRLQWAGKPLTFDEVSGRWSFTGIAEAIVRYDMRYMFVDLVRVRFPDADGFGAAWVVVGIERKDSTDRYLSRGVWPDSAAAYQALELGETVLKVSIAGHPAVALGFVDWKTCETEGCQFGEQLEEQRFEISASFIQSGGNAPAWYAWGFLFWEIQPGLAAPHPPRTHIVPR